MSNYFYKIEIPTFIEKVQLSKHRRATYFKKGSVLPKKYCDELKFEYNDNNILVEVSTGEKVIKNSLSAGKPNMKTITGQYFWVGAHPHLRRKIKNEMSEYFYNYMIDIPTLKEDQYPIGIRIDLYDTIRGQDLDNFIFVYRKVIHDILTAKHMDHKAMITDDSKKYIQDIPTKFYPIEDHEKRKLCIEIYSIK